MATAAALHADLRATIDSSDQAFVSVDCSGVTFIDSAGYHVLVAANQYAVRRGHTLILRNMSSSCSTLIRLCDIERDLRVEGPARFASGVQAGPSLAGS